MIPRRISKKLFDEDLLQEFDNIKNTHNTFTSVVSTQTAMLALTAEVGDICIRTDLSKTFILKAEPATTLTNWQELLSPVSPVQSVPSKFVSYVGEPPETEFTIPHNLDTEDVVVNIVNAYTGKTVFADIARTSENEIKVSFANAPFSNQYKVTIIG